MSEIEQASEPDKHIPNGTNEIANVEPSQQSQEPLLISEDLQASLNGTVVAPSNAQSTPTAAPLPIKRFSSANISKKFLQKSSSALNSNNASSTANSSSSSPAPTKAAATTASKPGSTTGTSRLVTTKLTQTPTSSISKWSKDTTIRPSKPSTPASEVSSTKPGQSATKVTPNNDRAADGSNKAVWGSVVATSKANARVQNDFPTAAELKERADQAAAASAAQRRALDAFRGVHLDPKAQHWDEMTEEDGDFLSGVIEFGDGKQYNVAPAPDSQPAEETNSSEDRLGNDFDRSWPGSRENGMQPPQPSVSPSVSPLATAHGERVLFNERQNRMEPMPPRQAPTTPTLLHAHPSPQTLRAGTTRRESDGRGFREPPAWNAPPQRSTFTAPDTSDRQVDSRFRRPSASERDKAPPYASGGLGPHLRDRSPDGSGRFPGRNIQRMGRRDSQASSAVPSAAPRSTRALSRESSDRGSGVRQLPPHLASSKAPASGSHAPPLVTTGLSMSVSSRASWRGSPTDIRSPNQAPQTPSVIHSDTMQPNARSGNTASVVSPVDSTHASQQDVAASLIGDEAALKASMAVAAERARKRRLEEEEKRSLESERTTKKKLADLEAKMQAEKEAKQKAQEEAEAQVKREREEADRVSKLEAENRAKEKERAIQAAKEKERVTQAPRMPPTSRPSTVADTAESWRGSGPVRPSITTSQPSSRRLTNGSTDSKRSPTVILKQRYFEQSQVSPAASKPSPIDLSGKPANSAVIAELAALQSKTADDSVQILHFSDLRQLAEGYEQSLSSTVAVDEADLTAPPQPTTSFKSPTETRSARPHETGTALGVPHSPLGGGLDDSKGFKPPRAPKSHPPAALNFVPRGAQDGNQLSAPISAGLSPSWSPRVSDPGYRQAPISVLDDTLSRFKAAIMHSNPVHAGMSSDDIMQDLGRSGIDADKGTRNSSTSPLVASAASSTHGPDVPASEPAWAQTQLTEHEEEDKFPSVLIPTLSLKRQPVPPKKIHGMKLPQAWRWDHLTFDPPVLSMNHRTLSVIDTLSQVPTGGSVQLRVKVPGAPVRHAPYADSLRQTSKPPPRPRREDLRVNASSFPSPTPGSLTSAPKTAPSNSQWPNKSRGSEEAVWRRAVPVTASLDQPAVPGIPDGPAGMKSAPGTRHNRTFSNSISPVGTPPQTMSTWGRSPLSLTVTEDLPDDPSLKAAWNKGSEAQSTKNSLRDIADEPPPQIPSSINDVRSEDGDAAKNSEKAPTPPTTRLKYDPHRAFQQVSSQPPVSQPAQESSPVPQPSSLSSSMYPTPRSNALALSTNRTPRQTPPASLPPPAAPPMNPPRNGYAMPYQTSMHPVGSPYVQPMIMSQYPPASSPAMAPPTPNMVHRNVNPGMPMQQPPSNPPMWGQQSPAAASPPVQMGYVRSMHPPLPPAGAYPSPMVQQAPQALGLYPHPGSGMMHHPPSPAMSPMMAPGMNKPFTNPQRQNSLPGGMPTMAPSPLPVSVPVTFQMPPSTVSHGQMPYMMQGAMHPPTHSPQGVPPHARPQGRGAPMHPSHYSPAPNNFPRPW